LAARYVSHLTHRKHYSWLVIPAESVCVYHCYGPFGLSPTLYYFCVRQCCLTL